ncbi:MAG: hypothetical protein EXS46_02705 [Candidatus Taylorbacteria bacterium]|nr:hypothetical protein [Candidatus Taylorbacteria bacterium]
MVICLLALFGIIYLIFWLTDLSVIKINRTEVTGAKTIAFEEVASTTVKLLEGRYFFMVPRANVLFYPKKKIVESITSSYPQIESISIKLKDLNTVQVTIKERSADALWCTKIQVQSEHDGKSLENCYKFDSTGLIYLTHSFATSTPSGFIKFFGKLPEGNPVGMIYSSPERIKKLLDFSKKIFTKGLVVTSFEEKEDGELEVMLFGGTQRLLISGESDFSVALANFQTIIEDPSFGGIDGFSKIDYVDLRYGNKVIYKIKSASVVK